jgi:iron complex outermembrane receptor protein
MSIERSKLNRLLAGLMGAPIAVGAFALSVGVASSASAEEALEEVVVTGSRAKPRTVEDSPIPVDVFSQAELEEVGYTDANVVIKSWVPSFSIGREPISDGATFIRPAALRDLPTDKTLVLVNSKRRHRAALVTIGGSGTQGPDIATIPMSAIKNIEVLRDGAGAIYGTDAIAGTINFILKDNSEGGSLSVDMGEYSEGDGTSVTVRGNIGLPLGDSGFLSISGETYKADATYRGEQYCQSWWCVEPGYVGNNHTYDANSGYAAWQAANPSYASSWQTASLDGPVVQPWGRPNEERSGVFYNAAIPLANGEIYSFGNYTTSEADGGFFYRYPGNGTIEDLRTQSGGIYSPMELYPGGFTPRFFGEVTDVSVAGGWRGELSGDLSLDLSARYGSNEISYTLKNTINPSYGDTSTQKDFRPGDLTNTEFQIQADFSYALSDAATLAFGLSYLDEEYEITQGELASYEAGPYSVQDPWGFCTDEATVADRTATDAGAAVIANGSTLNCANGDDPVYQVVGVGSNGFPGYSPAFSGTYSRDSYALYAEINGDASDAFSYQAAIRYEDYSDFDSEVIGKVAGIYKMSDAVAIRGSFGTGFRAPTPGQQGTTNVSTRLPNGFPVATGLFPAGGAVAQALGASPLEPEKSTQYTVGLVLSGERASVTIDAYVINLDDRFNSVSTQDVSTDPTSGAAFANYEKLAAAGVAGANSIGGVFWFTNAFDTSSKGVDIVATMPFDFDNSSGKLTASLNYNKTEFESEVTQYFSNEDKFDFLNNAPNTRWILTYNHYMGDLSLMGRLSYFGEADNQNGSGANPDFQQWDAVTFIDLEAAYQVTEQLKVMLGGRNVTDEYPDKDELGDDCCGRIYDSGATVDWQGAYYYGRVTFEF